MVSNSDRFLQVLGILPVLKTKDVIKENAIFQILQHTNGIFGGLEGDQKKRKKERKEDEEERKEKKKAEVHASGSDFNKASVSIPTPRHTNLNTANIVTPVHLPLP